MLELNVCFIFPERIPNSYVLKLSEDSDISRLMIFFRWSWRYDGMIFHSKFKEIFPHQPPQNKNKNQTKPSHWCLFFKFVLHTFESYNLVEISLLHTFHAQGCSTLQTQYVASLGRASLIYRGNDMIFFVSHYLGRSF